MLNGMLAGYWEWFRLDGTKMRSGHFLDGQQVGEWTTYDKNGQVYKVTQMKGGTKKTERIRANALGFSEGI